MSQFLSVYAIHHRISQYVSVQFKRCTYDICQCAVQDIHIIYDSVQFKMYAYALCRIFQYDSVHFKRYTYGLCQCAIHDIHEMSSTVGQPRVALHLDLNNNIHQMW